MESAFNSSKKSHYIIWLSLIASVVSYVFVAWLTVKGDSHSSVVFEPIVIFLSMLALSSVGLSFLMPHMLRKRIVKEMKGEVDNGQRLEVFRGKLLAVNIIGWALVESVAIYGLVLTFITQNLSFILWFSGLALLLFLLRKPKSDSDLENLLNS